MVTAWPHTCELQMTVGESSTGPPGGHASLLGAMLDLLPWSVTMIHPVSWGVGWGRGRSAADGALLWFIWTKGDTLILPTGRAPWLGPETLSDGLSETNSLGEAHHTQPKRGDQRNGRIPFRSTAILEGILSSVYSRPCALTARHICIFNCKMEENDHCHYLGCCLKL